MVKALRAGLETLGRPPGGSAAGVGDVPWANVERLETACGPLFRRRQIHPVNTRIGSVCLGAALDADVRQLSLLGLEPSIASHDVSGALFVDTETTGLGGSGCLAFLVGLAWFEAGSVVLDQYVLTGPQHERAMLETVRARIARASYLVSYNGKSFDVPMLATRWIMNRIKHPEDRPHLDLLHLVRRVHRERTWRKTLKSAEQHVLGFDRGPDVGGAEVAERYQRYLHNGNSAPLEEVMRHNAHDVMSLVALVGMYGEPLQRLDGEDLASAARVFQRAGDLDCAAVAAERALSKGGGAAALRARGFIAKANGDKRCALADFEAIAAQSRDLEIHLELAKLYEHFCREPRRALETIAAGTTENALAHQRRTRRLQRKCARLAAKC